MAQRNATVQTIETSPFQAKVLSAPEAYDLFLGGGRGGAKSYSLALLALRHVAQYKDKARILYVRKSYKGIADYELVTRDLFGTVYGPTARYNGQEHVWRFPNDAYFELGEIADHSSYAKYQGRSFNLLLVDEAGQWAEPALLDLLRSNLRATHGIPTRVVTAANPGDVGHAWIAKRYVFAAAPWTPFYEPRSKRTWVSCPSTYLDNPFIDQAAYRDQLESSAPNDPELLRAWIAGDWAAARGAYFAGVIDEARNAIGPWSAVPRHTGGQFHTSGRLWDTYLCHDFGSAAPSATYVVAQSPGATGPDGRWYPRGSLVLLDELATNKPNSLSEGLGWTVPILAEAIVDLCRKWRVIPQGVADDAIFAKAGYSAGSIAEEFRRFHVHFSPARKGDRLTGWNVMRRLLADAGKPDVPGLYVSRSCRYWWETVPYLGRDPKRVEDVDSGGPDHAADATRYGCMRLKPGMVGGVQIVIP